MGITTALGTNTALLVFLGICGFFFLVLLITLLLGGDADHDADVSGHDGDHGGETIHHWLSLKVVSAFGTGFGAAGGIANIGGLSLFWQTGVGLAVGIAMAAIVDALIAFLYRQQSTSNFDTSELIGKPATVTLGILPGKIGEVSIRYAGANIAKPARSQRSQANISQGTVVKV